MEVVIDTNAGYCFGVKNAVKIAEQALREYGMVYCLGDIVHNEEEKKRLEKMGLRTITKQQFARLKNERVLIRAHGEPPETYTMAEKNNVTLIDATCPVVSHLQKKIRTCYDEIHQANGQVVIFGSPDHAEVIGLKGQTGDNAIVVSGKKELAKIDFSRPVYLYSQTTKSRAQYLAVRDEIERRIREKHPDRKINIITHDTICQYVAGREETLKQFVSGQDVMIFVSGKNSSNGRQLFEVCRSENPASYFISSPEELELPLPGQPEKVGISGATSTPVWLMENIADKIRRYYAH